MTGPIVIDANCFVSTWHVKPEQRDLFIKQFDALWQADEAGLRQVVNFVFYGWGRDENEFVAIESWKNEADVVAIRKTEGFQKAVGDLMALCEGNMEMQLFAGMQAPRDWLFTTYPVGPSVVHPRAAEVGAVFR